MHASHADGHEGFLYGSGDEESRQTLQSRAAEILSEVAGADSVLKKELLPEVFPVEAAVACGYCRLYGGDPPEFPFPEWLAMPAANRLQVLIEESSADAENLPAAWDAALPDEAEDLVASLLFARMDAWAAFETLDAAVEAGGDEALRERIEICQDTLANFDRVLWDRLAFVSTLAETQLLVNWRLSLAAPYRVPLPWWLNGTVEEAAVAVDRSIAVLKREIFGPPRAVPPTPTLPLPVAGPIRGRVQQIYAAAADGAASSSSLTPLYHWRSPNGSITARLHSPIDGPQVKLGTLLMEFYASNESTPHVLRGCMAVLGGQAAPIEWQTAGGAEVAKAEFPSAAIFDESAPELVVFPDADPWKLERV